MPGELDYYIDKLGIMGVWAGPIFRLQRKIFTLLCEHKKSTCTFSYLVLHHDSHVETTHIY